MRYSQLVSHFGSLTKAASEIGKPKQTVWNWKDAGIPEVEQLEIQMLTAGQLRAERRIVERFRKLLMAA